MTDKEKASKVLDFLQDLDTTCVIDILHPLISDRAFAKLYDDMEFLINDDYE